MPCSPAQLAANRRNSALSTGPRTEAGKAASRRNGLKHGLAGRGVVLPEEDAEALDDRLASLETELRPSGVLERTLVRRLALMTVRLDRSAEHEAASLSRRVRLAVEEFDDARLAEVELLYGWIGRDPETNARRLRRSPEGLAKLIEAMEALLLDLMHPSRLVWEFHHGDHLHHLMGRRQTEVPASRARALSEAILGRFGFLQPGDGERDFGLEDRRGWAIGELARLIDGELATLRARLDGFDRGELERDRAEAPARALFDPSPAAILARKYEAASERALYRALRELREIRAEAPEGPAVATEPQTKVEVAAGSPEELASCRPEPGEGPDAEADADSMVPDRESAGLRRRPDPQGSTRKARRGGQLGRSARKFGSGLIVSERGRRPVES